MKSTLTPVGPEPSRYVVMLRGVKNSNPTVLDSLESGGLGLSAVTQPIRRAVADDPSRQHTMVSDVLINGRQVPSFRGDILNGFALDERDLDPGRMVKYVSYPDHNRRSNYMITNTSAQGLPPLRGNPQLH